MSPARRAASLLGALALTICTSPASALPDAPARSIRLAAVGDVIFGRYKAEGGEAVYHPVTAIADPFAAVAPILRAADLAFANLETPLVAAPREIFVVADRTFRADPEKAGVLRDAGFDLVSLANNHVENLGPAASVETRRHLERAGLAVAGAGPTAEDAFGPALVEKNGLRLALLAFTTHDNGHRAIARRGAFAYMRERELTARVAPAIAAARKTHTADFVVVSLHWGREFHAHPDDEQRRIARSLVDAGADLVLGHHPHVMQDVERWHGGLIAYSLGNFLFDQPIRDRRETAILDATLTLAEGGRRAIEARLHPVLIGHRDHVPRPAHGPLPEERVWRRRLARLAPGVPLATPPAPVDCAAPVEERTIAGSPRTRRSLHASSPDPHAPLAPPRPPRGRRRLR